MNETNLTRRFLFDNTDVRGEITKLTNAYTDAYAHQTIPKQLIPLFGEFLAAASLLAEVLKFEGVLTLQAKGEGDIAFIMAETNDQGHLRGIVKLKEGANPNQSFATSLPDLLPKGYLAITIDPVKGERYQGIIGLEYNDLAGCIANYFEQSEQIHTVVSLYANETHAGGLFLQCLPPQLIKDEDARQDLWETLSQLASTCTEEELFELPQEQLLVRLFS